MGKFYLYRHYLIDLLNLNYFGTIDGLIIRGLKKVEVNHESTG